MNETRWIDRSQPDRLQLGTMMLYVTAAFDVISALFSASALTLVFLASLSVLLLVFVPFLAQQRQRMLDQDRRLLATLRRSYERELIYDLLSRDRESLAAHLVDLASQEDLVWVRVESGDLDLGASADPSVVSRLLGPEAEHRRALDEARPYRRLFPLGDPGRD